MAIVSREAMFAEWQHLIRPIAVALSRTTGLRVASEDLEQEGAIGLLRAIDRCDPTRLESFRGYATIRIRGAMRDAIRISARQSAQLVLAEAEQRDEAPSPLDLAQVSERSRRLAETVSRLPQRQRHVVQSTLRGQRQDELAASLGVTAGRVSQLWTAAKEQLRLALAA
jgi:RNA polymerase sigma factor FliA